MFIALQIPLADCRAFLESPEVLSWPVWSAPRLECDYVRRFGAMRPRRRGGLEGLVGEEAYCRAHRGFIFPPFLGRVPLGNDHYRFQAVCAFRRLFSDGAAVCRLEVGLREKHQNGSPDAEALSDIVLDVLNLQVKIPGHGALRSEHKKIQFCGSSLSQSYLNATSKASGIAQLQPWWVSAGSPCLVLECDEQRVTATLPHSRQVAVYGEIRVEASFFESNRVPICVWILKYPAGIFSRDQGNPKVADQLRRLRLHLLRLHAERETLKVILRNIQTGRLEPARGTPRSTTLQAYLRNASFLLQREKSHGFEQRSILDAVRRFTNLVRPGEETTLQASLERLGVRGNVQRQVNSLVSGNISAKSVFIQVEGDWVMGSKKTVIVKGNTVMGDLNAVAAETITSSFNHVQGSAASGELKAKIGDLTKLVEDLARQLPKEKQNETAEDLATFSKEAVREKPRKSLLELTGDGLIEAAKTVAQMAGPVTTAVRAVLALFP